MVNQQLLDYVKEQIQVGVSKDEIKGALIESGWPEGDVGEALASSNRASVVTTAPARPSSGASAVMTSDIFQPQNGEPMFVPGAKSGSVTKPSNAPSITPAVAPRQKPVTQTNSGPDTPGGWRKYLKFAVPGALVLALVGSGWFAYSFYDEKIELEDQLMTAQAEKQGVNDQLSTLAKDKNDMAAQVTQLTEENEYLAADLQIFKIPAGALSSATSAVSIQGTLHGGDKAPYTMTLQSGIMVNIKNGKDANVDAVLKPLVETSITISGEHAVGSRDITVNAVNGKGIPVAEVKKPAETVTAPTSSAPTE